MNGYTLKENNGLRSSCPYERYNQSNWSKVDNDIDDAMLKAIVFGLLKENPGIGYPRLAMNVMNLKIESMLFGGLWMLSPY